MSVRPGDAVRALARPGGVVPEDEPALAVGRAEGVQRVVREERRWPSLRKTAWTWPGGMSRVISAPLTTSQVGALALRVPRCQFEGPIPIGVWDVVRVGLVLQVLGDRNQVETVPARLVDPDVGARPCRLKRPSGCAGPPPGCGTRARPETGSRGLGLLGRRPSTGPPPGWRYRCVRSSYARSVNAHPRACRSRRSRESVARVVRGFVEDRLEQRDALGIGRRRRQRVEVGEDVGQFLVRTRRPAGRAAFAAGSAGFSGTRRTRPGRAAAGSAAGRSRFRLCSRGTHSRCTPGTTRGPARHRLDARRAPARVRSPRRP